MVHLEDTDIHSVVAADTVEIPVYMMEVLHLTSHKTDIVVDCDALDGVVGNQKKDSNDMEVDSDTEQSFVAYSNHGNKNCLVGSLDYYYYY